MPEAGTRERNGRGESYPLPVAARRRLWDAIWERLLAPVPSERRRGRRLDQSNGDGELQPQAPAGGRRDGEAA